MKKFTEKNVIKAIKDYKDIINRCQELLNEMSFSDFKLDKDKTYLSIADAGIHIQEPISGKTYDIPISYLGDERESHLNEYREKKEKKDRLELNRIRKYVK